MELNELSRINTTNPTFIPCLYLREALLFIQRNDEFSILYLQVFNYWFAAFFWGGLQ